MWKTSKKKLIKKDDTFYEKKVRKKENQSVFFKIKWENRFAT